MWWTPEHWGLLSSHRSTLGIFLAHYIAVIHKTKLLCWYALHLGTCNVNECQFGIAIIASCASIPTMRSKNIRNGEKRFETVHFRFLEPSIYNHTTDCNNSLLWTTLRTIAQSVKSINRSKITNEYNTKGWRSWIRPDGAQLPQYPIRSHVKVYIEAWLETLLSYIPDRRENFLESLKNPWGLVLGRGEKCTAPLHYI
mgnify:CR=1 FL=1